MKINGSSTLPLISNNQYKKQNINQTQNTDCYNFTCKQEPKENITFKGGLLSKLFGAKQVKIKPTEETNVSPYIRSLQAGIKATFDKDIPAANFASIMSPEEFKEELKNLNIENFDIRNKDATDPNKIYCADLDNATTFSTGKNDVYTLLEKVAQTADELYEKTGKKFLFAISDRDTIEGVQHAVRIIASEPEKFKNLKFIPSMKMSFTHKVPTEKKYTRYENSEMLVYGINPFSEKLVDYVSKTLEKRKQMTIDFIRAVKDLYPQFGYSVKEFGTQNKINFLKDFGVSNLYWRAREYVETKGDTQIRGIELTPEEIKQAAIQIINELYVVQQGSENRNVSTIGSRIVNDDGEINKSIKEVFRQHATHNSEDDDNQIIAPAENVLSEMIDIFKQETTRPVMAISAPFYLSDYFPDKAEEPQKNEQGDKKPKNNQKTFNGVVSFLKELQEKTDGMLIAFESKVPKYRLDDKLYKRRSANEFPLETFDSNHPKFFDLKEQSILKIFNNFIRKSKEIQLYEVGGSWHDPYKDKFTN